MSNNIKNIARRQFFALIGGGAALVGIAANALSTRAQQRPQTDPLSEIEPLDGAYALMAPTTTGGDAIDILLEDHRQISALMDRIAQTPASNPTQRTQLLQQLANLLTIHNASEENYIYPAIRDIAKRQTAATTLYNQQDQAKVLVFELDRLVKDNTNWDRRFATLRNAILAHVSQEEKNEFPRLRQAAGANMPALTAKVRQLRSAWNFTASNR